MTLSLKFRTVAAPLALACALALGACSPAPSHDFESVKTVSRRIDASSAKLLELRFRSGALAIEQSASGMISIEGKVDVGATDQAAAKLHAASLDFDIAQGKFTRIQLPDPPNGCDYVVDLVIKIPKNLNLRVMLGEGKLSSRIDPPMMTELQVGTGEGGPFAVDVVAPASTSAFIQAETNFGGIEIAGFEKKSGDPSTRLTRTEFSGTIGTPLQIVGKQMQIRVDTGMIRVCTEAAAAAAPRNAPSE